MTKIELSVVKFMGVDRQAYLMDTVGYKDAICQANDSGA